LSKDRIDLLMLGQMRPKVVEQAEREFNLHKAAFAQWRPAPECGVSTRP
jgi:hypothetical protein